MNDFSVDAAALEAVWRLQGTDQAWDELLVVVGARGFPTQVESLRQRFIRWRDPRHQPRFPEGIADLERFLGNELRQARFQSESHETGHPDDVRASARWLVVVALVHAEVAVWLRAEQDARYGREDATLIRQAAEETRQRTRAAQTRPLPIVPDPGTASSEFFGRDSAERRRW